MEVYIEYVILDNLIINFIIITLTLIITKQKVSKLNIFLSSLIGTTFAIVMPLISLHNLIFFIIKLCAGAIMMLILKRYKNFLQFIVTYLFFLVFTFVMGGVCFAIMFMLGANINIANMVIVGFDLPISLFLLLIIFFVYFLFKLLSFVSSQGHISHYTYSVMLRHNDMSYNLQGFLDTGNNLYYNNKPVIVLSYKVFQQIFGIDDYKLLLQRFTASDLNNSEYIMVNSGGGKRKMLVFSVDEITIFKTNDIMVVKQASVGLALSDFNSRYDCLLHNGLFA